MVTWPSSTSSTREPLLSFVDTDGNTWQLTAAKGQAAGMALVSEEPIAVAPTRRAPGCVIHGAPPARQVATFIQDPG